jgi:hypothetical protein
MFSQGLSGVLVASILLATSISTSFAQNDDSDFIKKRNSYPLWNGSLPAQPVDATQVLNLSAGVSNPKVFRGRSLS